MKKLLRPVILLSFGIFLLTSCAKEYSQETGSGGTPATGALLKDDQNNCLPAIVHGSYDAGVTMTDSNYVEMTVTVSKPGMYRIASDQQNGLSFADSGYFATIGVKTIKLGAIGTPILPITTDFTVAFDTSTCGFFINVSDGTGSTDPNTSDRAWEFSNGSKTFMGAIDTAFIQTGVTSGSATIDAFTMVGYIKNNPDSSFQIVWAVPPGTSLTTVGATYSTQSNALFYFYRYDGSSSPATFIDIYTAEPQQPPATPVGNMTITVTGYDNTTRVIEGIFSGQAQVGTGPATITITNGKFKARIAT